MRIGLVGAGRRGRTWAAAVQAALADRPDVRWHAVADADPGAAQALADAVGTDARASTLDVLDGSDLVVVAVPVRDRALVASEALRRGAHVFALWPPAASVVEVEAIGRLAEEAGREVAVAHALPVAPLVGASGLATALVSLDLSGPFDAEGHPASWAGAPWPHVLAGACGLLGGLARSSVRRVDAEAARDGAHRFQALMASFRFRSGFYAHLSIRRAESPAVTLRLVGPGGEREVETFGDEAEARALEIGGVLDAVRSGRAAPHGPMEAADTLRLTERVLRRIA